MEHGATRNFQAEKLLEEEEKRMQKEREEEELNNPMKVGERDKPLLWLRAPEQSRWLCSHCLRSSGSQGTGVPWTGRTQLSALRRFPPVLALLTGHILPQFFLSC